MHNNPRTCLFSIYIICSVFVCVALLTCFYLYKLLLFFWLWSCCLWCFVCFSPVVVLPSIRLNIYAFIHLFWDNFCIRLVLVFVTVFPCFFFLSLVSGGGGPSIDAMVSVLFATRFAIAIAVATAAAAAVGQIHIRFGHDWRTPRNLSPHCCRSNSRPRTSSSSSGSTISCP